MNISHFFRKSEPQKLLCFINKNGSKVFFGFLKRENLITDKMTNLRYTYEVELDIFREADKKKEKRKKVGKYARMKLVG